MLEVYQVLDEASSTLPQLFQVAEDVERVLLFGQLHVRVDRQIHPRPSAAVALFH